MGSEMCIRDSTQLFDDAVDVRQATRKYNNVGIYSQGEGAQKIAGEFAPDVPDLGKILVGMTFCCYFECATGVPVRASAMRLMPVPDT